MITTESKKRYRKKHKTSKLGVVFSMCISFFVGFFIVSNLITTGFGASGVQGEFGVPNLGVTFTDSSGSYAGYNASSTCTATVNSLTVKSTALYKSVFGFGVGADGKGTLVLKNEFQYTATLSFSYTISGSGSGGTISLGGTRISTTDTANLNGTKTISLSPNSTYTIINTCPKNESSTSTVAVKNITLKAPMVATTTFGVPTNGSYTVKPYGGATQTLTSTSSQLEYDQTETTQYNIVATPNSNFKFVCWLGELEDGTTIELADLMSSTLYITETTIIRPWFIASNTPVYKVENDFYTSFNDAITAANSATDKKIIPVCDSTIPSGNYTLSNGVSLLVPFSYDNLKTTYKYFDSSTLPDLLMSRTVPSSHVNLTVSTGAVINVLSGSKVYVPSRMVATGTGTGSYNGCPSGPHGRITLQSGSSIDLRSGAALYCFGYIAGSGEVVARSGSTVYEAFQIRSWRGGTATLAMFASSGNSNVFPMNQYYIQNIEACLTFYSGASHYIYASVNANNQTYPTTAQFIGSSSGMFKISSGYIKKYYEASTDMLHIDLYGNMNIQSFSLTMMGETVNTAYYVLPLTNNMDIHLVSYNDGGTLKGSTCTISGQNACFLPGSKLTIDEHSRFVLGASSGSNTTSLYAYTAADWKNQSYAGQSVDIIPVGYSTVNGDAAMRTSAGLKDAEFNINGEFSVNSKGSFYTTGSTSNIYSSLGTGKVTISGSAPSSSTTKQVTQSGTDITEKTISVRAAILKNGEHASELFEDVTEYTDTAGTSNTTFYYSKQSTADYTYGWWNPGERIENILTLTFRKEDGTTFNRIVYAGSSFTFPDGEDSSIGYKQKYWYAEGTSFKYVPGEQIAKMDDIGDQTFVAFYGGWLLSENKYLIYEEDDPTYAVGIYQIGENDGTSGLYAGTATVHGGDYCLFDVDGYFKAITTAFYYDSGVYASGDNKPYYFRNGVRTVYNGWYTSDAGHTYYFNNSFVAYYNGRYLINGNYYQFNKYGWLIDPAQIVDGFVYDAEGTSLVRGYGLFSLDELDGKFLYYNLNDGSIIKDKTIYVSKTNNYYVDGIEVKPGLYYFDSNGRMYYGNELLENHEFELIDSGVTKGDPNA